MRLISRLMMSPRGRIVFAHDVMMAGVSLVVSLYLRVGDDLFYHYPLGTLVPATLTFVAIAAFMFLFLDLYRGIWRYASLDDMVAIARATTLTILVFLAVMFLWTRLEALPRSVPFINWFVLMALLGGPRFLYRAMKDRRLAFKIERDAGRRVPVLLFGADDGADLFIRALRRASEPTYRVVGIVAEKAKRVGQQIHEVPVLGTADDMEAVVRQLAHDGEAPERLILTREGFVGAEVRALLDRADALGMTLGRLPRPTELRSGIEDRVEPRPIAIEDLLGRPQTPLDRAAMATLIAGRRVLVTGAGGSIGGELVRQIADLGPACLTLLDNSEYALYAIDQELRGRHPAVDAPAVLADVRDGERVGRVFAESRPELVFHAAALKHVPVVEAHPFEGVLTNVIGTANVADACVHADAAAMVLISTDKAVNPTSVMGATKRIAERYCQALDLEGRASRFVTVRFGNVLGSTGSVVPLFQRQLGAGGPLTVTHPEMTRYFMTVREAVELVLEASALGRRDDGRGRVYVLDMGEPVRILDLARQMIRLAGLRPDLDVPIETVGLRPGEKLTEETLYGDEDLLPTPVPGIQLAAPRAGDAVRLRPAIDTLAKACHAADVAELTRLIRGLVPEYRGGADDLPLAASG